MRHLALALLVLSFTVTHAAAEEATTPATAAPAKAVDATPTQPAAAAEKPATEAGAATTSKPPATTTGTAADKAAKSGKTGKPPKAQKGEKAKTGTLKPEAAAATLPGTLLPAESAVDVATLSLPPDSLSQWYPPQSEGPEWRLLMGRLGRAMQATADYNAQENREQLVKWANRLAENYRRIGEMVPEWADELDTEWMRRLLDASAAGDFSTVGSALHRLGTTCSSCHREYRAAVAILYNVPDYRLVMVENGESMEETPYPKAMGRLGTNVQRIRVAIEDGRFDTAKEEIGKLDGGMKDLANSCSVCHTDDARGRIFGTPMQQARAGFDNAVKESDPKGATESLGRLTAAACGTCHSIHRPAAFVRRTIAPID